ADHRRPVRGDQGGGRRLRRPGGRRPGCGDRAGRGDPTGPPGGGPRERADAPFVEIKEAVGGYGVLEADDLDAAIELAARIPPARLGGAIEIRPSETDW